jgi:multicomponent Na+:H+ antiporter subunit D
MSAELTSILSAINPGFVLVLGGLLLLVVPGRLARGLILLGSPVLGLVLLIGFSQFGVDKAVFQVIELELITYRVDNLNFIFGLAFLIAALLNGIYAYHLKDRVQDASGLVYAGAAVAATFAGDLMTLFIFWEITAISSVFLIWRTGTHAAYKAGMRYLAIQILSGVLLLDGAAYYLINNGDMRLTAISLEDKGAWLLFVAIGIKAAFPFLHNWLQDSYPKATPTGAVILSAFTTKLAVYALARFFPGEDALIWIGAIMTVFPVFFAVVENDLRKVLSYSLNNQVGFMVCAIGIGTPLALNGAAAHAFAHIMYKGLLFMAMGAVLHRVGTTKASELGGLYRAMPFTALFCLIGAASISAFPFFSGFIAKSLTMSAVQYEGLIVVWVMLLFASAGVLEHSGIKIPYFAFFGHDSGKRPKEAPFNMLLAMGGSATICVLVGLPFGYQWLYMLLPYPEVALAYKPFTFDHVLTQMQLLVLAAFAFALLMRYRLYPPERPGTILDFDWVYRRPGLGFMRWAGRVFVKVEPAIGAAVGAIFKSITRKLEFVFSPEGRLSQSGFSVGMAVWTAVVLTGVLLMTLISGA